MNFTVDSYGRVFTTATEAQEKRAKEICRERDRGLHVHTFREVSTDVRWIGDLGEIIFDEWLWEIDHTWVHEKSSMNGTDFIVAERRVNVGTIKRSTPLMNHFKTQITARHAAREFDELFFMSYRLGDRQMYLVGGIDKEVFLSKAKHYGEGEWVTPHYQIRQGHEIYNLPIIELAPAHIWKVAHRD